MKFQGSGFPHRLFLTCGLAAGLAMSAGTLAGAGQSLQSSPEFRAQTSAFQTTVDYVVQFYPLWFTYNQSRIATRNRLVGPARISPLYHIVVAINDDTLYASTFLDLKAQPVILTIPATKATYSVLTLDPYGNIIPSGISPPAPGKYAFTGPGFSGTLPPGVTAVAMPLNFMTLIFRVDKFSAAGENEIKQAGIFRRSLRVQTLCDYLNVTCPDGKPPDSSGGYTLILPEIAFSIPFKTIADELITRAPTVFLTELQTAVASSNTPPLSPAQQALSNRFEKLFRERDYNAKESPFTEGARAAHRLILNRYLNHTGPTNWIHFRNIGNWGDQVVDRSSITEFIQYGNGISTAAYYHAFEDGKGRLLDGNDPLGYVLTFSKKQIPEAERFWSITAYTPEAIELVPNSANKYLVASYTEGLQHNPDGSLSIYLARNPPAGKPTANWLPIPRGPFNIMLRVYGPEGKVAKGTYVPPGIKKRH